MGPFGPGDFEIVASSPGKASARAGLVLGPLSSDVWLPPLRLDDEILVSGVVVDASGTPVRGARLVLDYRHDLAGETDAEGRFELHGFGEEAKEARISAAFFLGAARRVSGERERLRWVLERAPEVRGRALDEATDTPVVIQQVGLFRTERRPDGTKNIAAACSPTTSTTRT